MPDSPFLIGEFSPVKLELLPWSSFIADHGTFAGTSRTQRANELLELRDAAGIAQRPETFEHADAVGAVILLDPGPNLLLVGVELPPFVLAFFGRGRSLEVLAHRWPANSQRPRNLGHRRGLVSQFVYVMHCPTPEHCGPPVA